MRNDRAPVCIVGYGYVGRRVALRWVAEGAGIEALVRGPQPPGEQGHPGIELHRGDLDEAGSLPVKAMAGSRLYYFAPPPRGGVRDTRVRALIEALEDNSGPPPAKIVLISTTGVYGDCRGQWVDETRPPSPGSDRARRRLDAERVCAAYAARRGVPLAILRVAGIYGPDRLPEKRLREQTPLPAAEYCGFTNRIHVDDLVEICFRMMQRTALTGVFNVSDGTPGTMREYFDALADRLGYPRLPVVSPDRMAATVNTRMMTYLGESRRIDNSRVLQATGFTLRYPDLESGLAGVSRSSPGP